MRDGYAHDYPPSEWTVEDIERTLRATDGSFDLPTADDEHVWERLREDELTAPHVTSLLEDASGSHGEPVPPASASDYLAFVRTGDRAPYHGPIASRISRLQRFATAECFERDGTYLDDVLDYAWALCEQSTWVVPAHLRGAENHEGLPGVVDDEDRAVALYSTWTAAVLAELDHLLGDRLHPALRERIRVEVDRRVLTPYLARDDHHWLSPPAINWNAVCNADVATAALLLLDDPAREAAVVAKVAHTLEHYLANFDADGCTAEGIHYWNYGFGHYTRIAATLAARTDGELSLLSVPVAAEIAQFPLRVALSPGRYVPFSDTKTADGVSPGVVSRLGRELGDERLGALGRWTLAELGPETDTHRSFGTLRDLRWTVDVPTEWERAAPPRQEFFGGHEWWLARADPEDEDGLVVAAKGGYNDEPHNHNDCGSFVVHTRGESLLSDPGRPDYDRDYFDDDHRYDYLAARSLGHSVPFVNGCEQAHGREYAARVIDRQSVVGFERIEFDLTGCYPSAAALDSLRRAVTLEREGPARVVVRDRATLAPEADRPFESVLVSYAPMDVTDGALVVSGERGRAAVSPDPAAIIDVERLPEAVFDRDVWRARIAPQSHRDGETVDIDLSLTVDASPV